jgi:hypothetical protein
MKEHNWSGDRCVDCNRPRDDAGVECPGEPDKDAVMRSPHVIHGVTLQPEMLPGCFPEN